MTQTDKYVYIAKLLVEYTNERLAGKCVDSSILSNSKSRVSSSIVNFDAKMSTKKKQEETNCVSFFANNMDLEPLVSKVFGGGGEVLFYS